MAQIDHKLIAHVDAILLGQPRPSDDVWRRHRALRFQGFEPGRWGSMNQPREANAAALAWGDERDRVAAVEWWNTLLEAEWTGERPMDGSEFCSPVYCGRILLAEFAALKVAKPHDLQDKLRRSILRRLTLLGMSCRPVIHRSQNGKVLFSGLGTRTAGLRGSLPYAYFRDVDLLLDRLLTGVPREHQVKTRMGSVIDALPDVRLSQPLLNAINDFRRGQWLPEDWWRVLLDALGPLRSVVPYELHASPDFVATYLHGQAGGSTGALIASIHRGPELDRGAICYPWVDATEPPKLLQGQSRRYARTAERQGAVDDLTPRSKHQIQTLKVSRVGGLHRAIIENGLWGDAVEILEGQNVLRVGPDGMTLETEQALEVKPDPDPQPGTTVEESAPSPPPPPAGTPGLRDALIGMSEAQMRSLVAYVLEVARSRGFRLTTTGD